MEKKLTAQGPKDRKSYTVTLPIEWIKKEKLDKKKSVNLEVAASTIVISSHAKKEERVLIDGDIYSNSLLKVLQELYRAGIDEIKINFSDEKIIQRVVEILEKSLIGYEILEQKKDQLLIKDITKESEEDFKIIFRRIFLLLLELFESENKIQVHSIDRNIKKLINYCQRILIKKGHSEFSKVPFYYLILDRLEKIKDEMAWLLLLDGKKPSELKEIRSLLRTSYELFYEFNEEKFAKYQYRTYLLRNEIKLTSKMEVSAMHLHNLARMLNALSGDIFVLKFDSAKN